MIRAAQMGWLGKDELVAVLYFAGTQAFEDEELRGLQPLCCQLAWTNVKAMQAPAQVPPCIGCQLLATHVWWC